MSMHARSESRIEEESLLKQSEYRKHSKFTQNYGNDSHEKLDESQRERERETNYTDIRKELKQAFDAPFRESRKRRRAALKQHQESWGVNEESLIFIRNQLVSDGSCSRRHRLVQDIVDSCQESHCYFMPQVRI